MKRDDERRNTERGTSFLSVAAAVAGLLAASAGSANAAINSIISTARTQVEARAVASDLPSTLVFSPSAHTSPQMAQHSSHASHSSHWSHGSHSSHRSHMSGL